MMASGSGKNPDDTDPVRGQCDQTTAAEPPPPDPAVAAHARDDPPGGGGEGASAAAAAAAAAEEDDDDAAERKGNNAVPIVLGTGSGEESSSVASAGSVRRTTVSWMDLLTEEEDDDEAAAAAAAADRKGKNVAVPSWTPSPPSSAGSSPPTALPVVLFTGSGESSSVASAGSVRRTAVSWMDLLREEDYAADEDDDVDAAAAAAAADRKGQNVAVPSWTPSTPSSAGSSPPLPLRRLEVEGILADVFRTMAQNRLGDSCIFSIQGSSQQISIGMPQIPEDIQRQILLCLPTKDILRCQRVCRMWRKISNSADFRRDHARHWSSALPVFFYGPIFPWKVSLDFTSIAVDLQGIELGFRKSTCILRFPDILGHTLDPDDPMSLHLEGCCGGILLLSYKDDLCACCPYSGCWRRLPPIHVNNVILAFYKCLDEFLVLYRTDEPNMVRSFWIYNLGRDTVRKVHCPKAPGSLSVLEKVLQRHPPSYEEPPISLGANLYWLLHLEAPNSNNQLVAFSTSDEHFCFMSPPESSGIHPHQLFQINGNLALSIMDECLTSLEIWLHQGCLEGSWIRWNKIVLPSDEIGANSGLKRFGEPIVYIVSDEMEILVDCPETLLQASSQGVILQYHGHTRSWGMTVPHLLEVCLDVPPFMDKRSVPPFFRFVDLWDNYN